MFVPGSYLAEQVAAEHRQEMLREAELDRLLRETRQIRRSQLALQAGRLLYRFGCQLVALGKRGEAGREPAQGTPCSDVPLACAP